MLESLGIQWPKLIAQFVNFSIVLFVLWRFAYKPIFTMLQYRRDKIAESLANADKIKVELARTEVAQREILDRANVQANKFIEEARASAAYVREQEMQKAIAAAEQIINNARQATTQDHARMLAELKKEIGRLVVQTTVTVTGKVLNPDDQKRLAEEAAKQLKA